MSLNEILVLVAVAGVAAFFLLRFLRGRGHAERPVERAAAPGEVAEPTSPPADEAAARIAAERLAAEEAARIEAERLAAEEAARRETERLAAEEAARIEAERLAAEEAARREAERLAAEEAARREAERLAAEETARIEAERLAVEEALRREEEERKAVEEAIEREIRRQAEEEAARIEAERLAAEEAARLEAERLAAEEAARREAERRAAEEAARRQAERRAAEEAARRQAERRAAEEAARREAERLAAAKAAAARVKSEEETVVMVADDSKVVRVKTSRVLTARRYQVVTAEDGLDAARQIEQSAPDVLITDVDMPGMNGLQLAKLVRARPETARLPIIMITSDNDQLRAEAEAAGVDVVLGKPYPEEQLIGHIQNLVRNPGGRR